MMQGTETKVTILNSMAGRDFEAALDQHVAWGLEVVDLKDAIFGKRVLDLTDEEAERAAGMIAARGLGVACLSTDLFYDDIEKGWRHFRDHHLKRVDRAVALARIFRPTFVRLLAARTQQRDEVDDGIALLLAEYDWLFDLYRVAIKRLSKAGVRPTIENEVHGCILAGPAEITGFFYHLGCGDRCSLTWDVQNLWQMGTYPSLAVYDELRDLIGYYHLKGGIECSDGDALCWRSSLADASWPVVEITRRVIADGVSPIICLNPSHGEPKPGYDYDDLVRRDLAFVRETILEV
jgi:sugar phosphate isomerase/epimerase